MVHQWDFVFRSEFWVVYSVNSWLLCARRKLNLKCDSFHFGGDWDNVLMKNTEINSTLIAIKHTKGYLANSDSSLWNCHGHNSNFRVIQVEMGQEISQACRPLSQQTSESLYKKAENELLIFRFSFFPSLSYSPLVLSFHSLNEGQHRFPCHCHRDAQ